MAKNLVIKTVLDNKELSQGITSLKKQLQDLAKDHEKSNASQNKELEKLENEYKKLEDSVRRFDDEYAQMTQEMKKQEEIWKAQGYNQEQITDGLEIMAMDYDEMVQKSGELYANMEIVRTKISDIKNNMNAETSEYERQTANVKQQILQSEQLLEKKKAQAEQEKKIANLQGKVSDGLSKTIKKAGRWALAIFSVRSAYTAIRSVISTVSEYNEELANKIESMKYTLAMALEPIVERIVNWVYKLIQYINALSIAWFGVDLFANAVANSTAEASKNAKEMKKSLAGFDTANILSDSSSSSSGGGSTPTAMTMENVDTKSVVSFWDNIFSFWENDWASFFSNIDKNWKFFWNGIGLTVKGLVDVVMGVVDIIIGLFDIIVGAISGDEEKVMEGLNKLYEGFKKILFGLLEIVVGLVAAITGAVIDLFINIAKWCYNKTIKPIIDGVTSLWNNLKTGATNSIANVKNSFSAFKTWLSNLFSSIVTIFRNLGTKVGDAVSGGIKTAINSVLTAVQSILNSPINAINALLTQVNKLPGVRISKLSTFSFPKLAVGGIVNNPGRGVPVGGAIAGEAGREGVLPLTDSQAMQQLGQEIGKWISVNVDLTTKLDSRVLSRSLEKVQQNNSFVRNGV